MADSRSPPFAAERSAVDAELVRLCDELPATLDPTVGAALRYTLVGGGKRMRAVLLLRAYDAAGGMRDASYLAAAVEVVHAYSLVHDDLPCMDDDDVRRGRPSTHRAFGVAAATAAGLAMVPLAARTAYRGAWRVGLAPPESAAIVARLMRAGGAGGMIGGQLLDLDAEGVALSLDQLERVHRAKTGALIGVSARLGAMAAGVDEDTSDAFQRFGLAVGHAFQIADDVLDVTATSDELGKTAGRDLALRKSTYPALLGVEGARARAEQLVDSACETLRVAGVLTPPLEELARYAVRRRS